MRPALTTKFVVLISAIAAMGFLNGLTAFLFTRSVANCFREAVRESLPSVKAAEELQIALSDQKGLVAAYILDGGNASWLERLRAADGAFGAFLSHVRANAKSGEKARILDDVVDAFSQYDTFRNKALGQYHRGQRDEAAVTLLKNVWPAYDKTRQACRKFIEANERYAATAADRSERYVALAIWGVSIGSVSTAGLALLLLGLVIQRVLVPLRRMAADARGLVSRSPAILESADDELRSVGRYFSALMADVADSRNSLAQTRDRMRSAEKLAAVGKLAASVAHEMRNPLSSIKMWLYSIRNRPDVDPDLEYKYQILADEIARLESIVRNVLEFSRPPALKLEPWSVPEVLDRTLELVSPWLEAKSIRVVQKHARQLPEVMVDGEQLRQVLTNLLYNAAEAMSDGGEIVVSSARDDASIVMRIQDSGRGIPEEVRARLFEPFFTTKDEGTGLGLCIAANIMARHGGQLVLESSGPAGTTFAVRLPVAEETCYEQDSRR